MNTENLRRYVVDEKVVDFYTIETSSRPTPNLNDDHKT